MKKLYLYLSNKPFDSTLLFDALSPLGELEAVEVRSETMGQFYMDADKTGDLEAILETLPSDLGVHLTILCSHGHGNLEDKLLPEALAYYPNQVVYPTDLLLKELSMGSFTSYRVLNHLFENVPSDLLLTVGTYLRLGLDAQKAAKRLGVHRNTFLYRINRFIELSNLDIRDYHNALLLELYFQLCAGKLD